MKAKRIPLPLSSLHELDALYATLPRLDCKRKCQNVCGVIEMSWLEWQRIINRKGYEPKGSAGGCPLLDSNGLCSVHDVRPLLCRLWGLIDDPLMRCHFGCVPERWVTRDEAQELFREVARIGEKPIMEPKPVASPKPE